MIDTHAHIYLEAFKEDRAEMIDRALDTGVKEIFMPNIDSTSIDDMMETEENNPDLCFSMMGLHPCSVNKKFEKELYLVEEWLEKRAFAAVGEIGTDLYWDKSFWKEQQEAFKIQTGFAKKYNLPIVIHCRESINETIELVKDLYDDNLTGVFHCFSGNVDQAKRILEIEGFFIGIGGVSTFKNGGLDKVLPGLPLERLVLETDSPYLAPKPHRGKRNEPAYLALIAARIAEIMDKDVEQVKEQTTANARELFNYYK
ncbi:MAG: TatD family hydrolase [Candidatus Cyclobacteriaceae bacterium M2_1C_046]